MAHDETTWLSTDAAEAPDAEGPRTGRYEALALVGAGGTGEVYKVRDATLDREVAMKVLRPDRVSALLTERFAAEARVVAGLQHPGLPPIHDLGTLADGRPFFTMGLVEGQPLDEVVAQLHAEGLDGPGLRRLVGALARVCEAVAYAHAQGVIHRDLKPANMLLGPFGEVFVVDWGLARTGDGDSLDGRVAGTPRYMAPEQARADLVDAQSDVYALGATLYHLLAGHPPYRELPDDGVLRAVRSGPPEPLAACTSGLPDDLVALTEHAMARQPDERPRSVAAVGAVLRGWLDGVRQRERAMTLVDRARENQAEAAALEREAAVTEALAEGLLAEVAPTAPETERYQGWALQDTAAEQRERARTLRARAEDLFEASLTHAPGLEAAHGALALLARASLIDRSRAGDGAGVAIAADRLERHLPFLPEGDEAREHQRWLRPDGRVVLHTDPVGAHVVARPFEERNRLLVEGAPVDLGPTPIDTRLPLGSWLLEVRTGGRVPLRYPVQVERGRAWTGVAPGASQPHPVPLLTELDADEVYVPAGWFVAGGYPEKDRREAAWRWADGFIARRDCVTNAEYVGFLNDLVRQGRTDEADQWQPRERGRMEGEGAEIYSRDDDGRFRLGADADGHVWRPKAPVVCVSWDAAMAYAAWLAETTGRDWHLPLHLQWEKAARGVDGRRYPWGNHFARTRACFMDAPRTEVGPADVGSFPVDTSVYGVRDLSGNCRSWCADGYGEDPEAPWVRAIPILGEDRVNRGGAWNATDNACDLRIRWRDRHSTCIADVGFRVFRPV